MADFNFYINRQGIQGRKGDKGDTGFSPTISVGTDTVNEYKLVIANEANSFETPNLRGNINVLDNGGTYLRYDAETQQISAQSLDAATSTIVGGVLMSTASDIETMGDNTVITPANLADALPVYLQGEGAVTITQDEETSKTKINVDLSSVDELSTRVSNTESAIVGLQTDVAYINSDISTLDSVTANHTASISSINNNITDLNNNKVAKTDFATTETAGIVKVDGTTITSTKDGTISANLNYTLPTASTTQLGGVKVDGTTITVDENGVITSVGGGSTGDVTAAGNNVFTGINQFQQYIYAPELKYDTSAWHWVVGSSTNFWKGKGSITTELNTVTLETPDGGTTTAPLKNVVLKSSGSIILKPNNNTINGDISMATVPRIKDGDGNIMLSQGNVTAGDNITIEKTDAGIQISSTASGGAAIDDNNISTTTVYSSDKTVNLATSLVDNAMITLNQTKQDTLVSGTNIKTINGQSILGEGDIAISGGGGDVPIATTETVGKVKPDGTTITVTEDGTISANTTAPTNMVTTDTRQTISEIKTFTNSVPMFFGEPNKSNYCGRFIMNSTYKNRSLIIEGGGDYTKEIGEVKLGYEGNGNNPAIGGVLIKSTPTYDANVNSDIGLKLGSTNNRCSITGDAGQIKLTANAIYPNKGYLKVGSDALTYVDNSGISHDLLAGGGLTAAQAAHAAMPSDKYVDLTLGASNSSYTAPADGWVNFSKKGTDNQVIILVNNNNKMRVQSYISANNTSWSGIILPVKKNDTFKAEYTCTGDTMIFRFIYAVGAESEAQ